MVLGPVEAAGPSLTVAFPTVLCVSDSPQLSELKHRGYVNR